ncbi:YqgE/AlgH family protein [Planctomicrobium sp. SH527]|uniref:YqgE/AlgH family protein n=1 Tax=Planctomicrobium sp. SH527 TaxID=3448123 RepID=UPI003F5C3EBA
MSNSLRGKFLVAGCKLRDPNFFKSAVLIVEHGTDGAMGLVVNQPTSTTVSHALKGHIELPKTRDLVYCGGPVEPAALFVIHNCAKLDPDESPIIPGVYMGSSAEVFEDIVSPNTQKPCASKYRIFCGCAGWEPGQLEDELSRGDWLIVPAKSDYVFHQDPYAIWDELVAQSQKSRRLFNFQCEHPEWN